MKVCINSKDEVIKDALTITELLKEKNVSSPEMVAVEINEEIIDSSLYDTTKIKEHDKIEFLYFMGGGSRLYLEDAWVD